MAETALNLSPTIPLQSLLQEAEREPFKMLEDCTLREVRQACLETLRRRPYGWIGERVSPDRIEELIRAFRKANDPIWRELFDWYIHFAGESNSSEVSEGTRAVEFAIALGEDEKSDALHEAAKAISDKLRWRPYLYWEAARMPTFLKLLLAQVKRHQDGYGPGTWRITERAIRRIVAAEDVTFIGHIDELFCNHRDGIAQPGDQDEDPFARVQNEALLAEAFRRLAAAKNAQTPDLAAAVGSFFRQKAALGGSVIVEMDYPTDPIRAGTQPIAVRVTFRTTGHPEQERLSAALGEASIGLGSDGQLEVEPQGGDGPKRVRLGERWRVGDQWGSGISRRFTDKLRCEFLIRSRPGRRRLWLSFQDGKTKLAELAIYITFK